MIHSEQLSFMGMSRAGGRTQLSMQKWMVRMYRHRVSEYPQQKAAVRTQAMFLPQRTAVTSPVAAGSATIHRLERNIAHQEIAHAQAINLDTPDIP